MSWSKSLTRLMELAVKTSIGFWSSFPTLSRVTFATLMTKPSMCFQFISRADLSTSSWFMTWSSTWPSLKGFAKHGLYKVPGKNVCSLYDAAWNIAKRLYEVEALPSDAAMDILTGLTKATNDDFTRPFKLLKDLSNQSIINIEKVQISLPLRPIKILTIRFLFV